MTGLIYDDRFLKHGNRGHPESAERLEVTMEHLEETGWLQRLELLDFEPATQTKLTTVHEEAYIHELFVACVQGGGSFTLDTVATGDTCEAGCLAVGGCIHAVNAAFGGEPSVSFAAVRPPGHHATANRAMGFCFLNNIAFAAEAALHGGLDRVAIVDFDVHHGNGTQQLFYHRRDVLYISLHEHGIFPGTGSYDEVGVEQGGGFTVNIPLRSGTMDKHYLTAFDDVVVPALEQFQPQFILVSAGYDGHHSDSLAGLNLSPGVYHEIATRIRRCAEKFAEGRTLYVLEGGYDLEAVPPAIENTLRGIEGEAPLDEGDEAPQPHPDKLQKIEEALQLVVDVHRKRLGLEQTDEG